MGFVANPAGINVGKTYGPRSLGAVNGVVKTEGIENEVVFEVTSGTKDAVYKVKLPAFYLVEGIYAEVETAFAASSTVDFSINGGAGLTTDVDLTVSGLTSYVLTGLANVKGGSSAVDMTMTLNANALASTTGKARVIVKYKRV